MIKYIIIIALTTTVFYLTLVALIQLEKFVKRILDNFRS